MNTNEKNDEIISEEEINKVISQYDVFYEELKSLKISERRRYAIRKGYFFCLYLSEKEKEEIKRRKNGK